MGDSDSPSDTVIAGWKRYYETGNLEDLEVLISSQRWALEHHSPGDLDYSNALVNLAGALFTRHQELHHIEDREESISLNREALALHPPGHGLRSVSLSNLAIALWDRYYDSRKMEDLAESILLNHEALTLHPPGHPLHATSLTNLAASLNLRYEALDRIEDLEESMILDRKALTFRPPGDPNRSTLLFNLAISYATRYRKLGKIEDLDESISLEREARALCPPGHTNRSKFLNNLASHLITRHQRCGSMADLEESISTSREVFTLYPSGHPRRHSTSINNLAVALKARYDALRRVEDLEESISLHRALLTLRPPGHPERSSVLTGLATIVWSRYQDLGKMDDLEESISLKREALALCPPGHPDHPRSLANLARDLSNRYEQLEKPEDQEESLSLNRKAVALCPPGHPNRSNALFSLAFALAIEFERWGKIEVLEEATALNREVVTLCDPSDGLLITTLGNLASELSARYERLGEVEDLEECIALHHKTLALRPPRHPHRSVCLNNLSLALWTRYYRLRQTEDLEESIVSGREALALCPPGHPDRCTSLGHLAASYRARYQTFGETEDAQEMFSFYEQAASDSTSYVKYRLAAAIQWAQTARRQQHSSTLHAYATVLRLLQHSLISRPDVEGQHAFLATEKKRTTLASDAASAAIQAGNLELAVEFLEQGRAMLWSRMVAYKSPLEQLRQVEGGGELADRLETLSANLEQLVLLSDRTTTSDRKFTMGLLSLDARIKQHRILSEEWEDIVKRIRAKPGFTHFLRTPSFETLRSASSDGPVIFINISDYRSDAIILTIDNPPILVPLSTIIPADLARLAQKLTSNRDIISVLRYLWDSIVSPVVARLSELGVKERGRIWWCPTAELCSLPLHAAGPYRQHQQNLPDIYTSSYTTTLSSLIRARSNIVQVPTPPNLLVVAQPHQTLRRVEDEVGIIVEEVKHCGEAVNILLGAEASHETVLDALKQHSWVHFACHGHLGDDGQPFRASFELHNGRRLTLLELIQARLPNAESAFLAACHSAAGDHRTPDENIHLSAALQFCGFRSVVGTLWEMFDEDGPRMSKAFYKYMFRNPERIDFRDSAQALNSAIREMKKAKLPPERWVMFVHIGA